MHGTSTRYSLYCASMVLYFFVLKMFGVFGKGFCMVLGIGTDVVQIDRFERWRSYSYDQMRRIFSKRELEDCTREIPHKESAFDIQRLAVRFAAKEAFFKALSATLTKLGKVEQEFSFLFLSNCVEVGKTTWNVPVLTINWEAVQHVVGRLPSLSVELSLSHEKSFAVAFVTVSGG